MWGKTHLLTMQSVLNVIVCSRGFYDTTMVSLALDAELVHRLRPPLLPRSAHNQTAHIDHRLGVQVATFLPAGLVLAPQVSPPFTASSASIVRWQTVAPAGKHPVVFSFGHQV